MLEPRIYLASRSPRRRELLQQIRVSFETLLFRTGDRTDHDVDETPHRGEATADYVLRVARAKAQAASQRVLARRLMPYAVLAADTTLDVDGEIIGKPTDTEDAVRILKRLSGRRHRVLTAVAVCDGDRIIDSLNENQVRFRNMDEREIRRYVATGEPMDKAGAYGVQGRAALFIEEIHGSYSGIMGLPLFETGLLLRNIGYPV
ncbi:MAG: nucleoside triphosphate pyrophosphatase [Rhodocyclaceae bacterium]|jgi:septum formation protein